MIRLDDLLRIYHIPRVELMAWIEEQWVRPQCTDEGWIFDEVDEARVKLIRELREDLQVGEEAMPVVLNLLDQVYSMRRVLGRIEKILQELPTPLRDQLRYHLSGGPN